MNNPKQLYILPFDHRASFFRDLFGWQEPLSSQQKSKVKEAKGIIFAAFKEVWNKGKCDEKCGCDYCKESLGILVDEEFGSEILRAARKLGAVTILTTEKSGQTVFDLEYGAKFGAHILKFKPDYAKVLVRYNPVNKKDNLMQLKRLKKISDFCRQKKIGFLFELLVPASPAELKKYAKSYDAKARPALSLKAIQEICRAGVCPDIWKLEAMPKNYWPKIIKVIKSKSLKSKVVILGRAGSKTVVSSWLKTAAQFKDIIGFAVGRTIFYAPLEKWRDGKLTKKEAINLIAKNFEYFIQLWMKNKKT